MLQSAMMVWMKIAASCSAALVLLASLAAGAADAQPCQRLTIEAEAHAGQRWQQPLGQGWTVEMVPVAAPYSGWDLAVENQQLTGYPDAVLLATPPWRSMNEREIATSYGLRAQDAVGWSRRSVRLITNVSAMTQARQLYAQLRGADPQSQQAASRLLSLSQQAATAQLEIRAARLVPGISDASPFAAGWAQRSHSVPIDVEQPTNGKPTPNGELRQISFRLTIWLPVGWHLPAGLHAVPSACSE